MNAGAHYSLLYEECAYLFCPDCGALFQVMNEDSYESLTKTIYTTQSWGKTRQDSIKSHGPRIGATLDWFENNEPFRKDARYLDFGAGIGIVEDLLFEKLGTTDVDLTALEPVFTNAEVLQKEFPQVRVVTADIEHVDDDLRYEHFDTVLCFGVDYLFRDLNSALVQIKDMMSNSARLLISRNVFLEMDCFWGGKPIRTFKDLVGSNPLISLFLFKDQYKELVSRHFKILSTVTGREKYLFKESIQSVTGLFLNLECLFEHDYVQEPRPIKKPERAFTRLHNLGVVFDA